jgi:hypothetical protein
MLINILLLDLADEVLVVPGTQQGEEVPVDTHLLTQRLHLIVQIRRFMLLCFTVFIVSLSFLISEVIFRSLGIRRGILGRCLVDSKQMFFKKLA